MSRLKVTVDSAPAHSPALASRRQTSTGGARNITHSSCRKGRPRDNCFSRPFLKNFLSSRAVPPDSPLMQQIQLQGSELRCSRLAYGCWRIIAAGKAVEVTPEREEDARKAILGAYDAGYTLFDHADIYSDGLAEWV